jgi:Na+/H+ antiporter NhaC
MRVVLTATLVVACRPSTTQPTLASVTTELVEAGCVTNSTTVEQSVQTELQGDASSASAIQLRRSIGCLFEGGTIASCAVPCDATTVMVTRP